MEIRLRDVTNADVEVFYEYQQDEVANRMAAFIPRNHAEHVAHWRQIRDDDTITLKTILADGRIVGNAVHFKKDGHHEIGYWIDREHWGRGIATAAVALFVEIVAERPLVAWVAEHNLGSIRMLEKCGFTLAPDQPSAQPGEVRYVVLELN